MYWHHGFVSSRIQKVRELQCQSWFGAGIGSSIAVTFKARKALFTSRWTIGRGWRGQQTAMSFAVFYCKKLQQRQCVQPALTRSDESDPSAAA